MARTFNYNVKVTRASKEKTESDMAAAGAMVKK